MRGGAGGPDAQAVEAGLQLGAQDEGGVGVVAGRMADEGGALVEAAAFQPGLQEAGRREVEPGLEMDLEIGADLVAPGLPGAEPALDLRANRPA